MTNKTNKQPSMFSSCISGLLIFFGIGALFVFVISSAIKTVGNKVDLDALKELVDPEIEAESSDAIPSTEIVDEYFTVQYGGVYSNLSETELTYSFYKVIGFDENVVHLIQYSDRYDQVPDEIQTSRFTIQDDHVMMNLQDFYYLGMELEAVEEFTAEELKGYLEYTHNN